MKLNFSVRRLCVLAVLAALSVVLAMFVRFPIFPTARYLEFDAGDVAILSATFLYGPLPGVLVTLVVSLIQGFGVSFADGGLWGILMHFVSTSFFCLVAGALYRRRPTKARSVAALSLGVVLTTLLMIPLNLLITPLHTGATVEFVASMLIPIIIPFNLIKFALNAVLSFVLWRSLKLVLKKLWGESEVA